MHQKIKIAYLVNHASFFFSHILPIAIEAKKKYKIKLFHGSYGSKKMEVYANKKIKSKKIKLERFNISPTGLNLFIELVSIFSLIKSISLYKPDLIHCATPKSILYGGLIARILKIKSLVIFNTGMGFLFSNKLNLYEKIIKRIYLFILKNIILKHKNKQLIIENKDDISFFQKKFELKNNEINFIKGVGINLNKYKKNYTNSKKIVLMPSRVIKEKGIIEFVTASQILKKKFPDWKFIIAGAIDYKKKSSLNKMEFRKLVNSKDVKFLGYVKNIHSLYKKASIVCLPSYREGFSKVFLEAAAMGIPIVTTNVVGCKDSILPGKTGLLCEAKNPQALVKQILYLIKNEKVRHKYSKNARFFALKNFDVKKVIFQNIRIYNYLIENEKKTNLYRAERN